MTGDPLPSKLRYRFADFEFHERTGELCRKGKTTQLPDQAGLVLSALLRASGEVVTREELRKVLWPGKVFGDFEGGLNAAVRKLRRALEDDGSEPRYIGTLPRRGYRLLVPAGAESDDVPDASPVRVDPSPAVPKTLRSPTSRSRWMERLVAMASRLRRRWASASPHCSIALLPLINLSGDRSKDYLAASLTEQLIQELALRGDLQVAPLAAVRCLDPESLLPGDLCRRLGVESLVEGSVRPQGDSLQIHLRLIAASSGLSVWAQSLKLSWKDLGLIPSRLALRLSEALALPAQVRKIPPPHRDAETLALQLEARHELSFLTARGLDRAVRLYEQALQRDPGFAEAYAGLTTAELWRGILGRTGASVALSASYRHAMAALELEPDCSEAHLALAFIHWLHDWDFPAAEASFRKVLELSPASFRIQAAWASYLFARGRDAEAEPHLAQAEPFAQGDPMVAMDVLRCYTFARRHAEALAFGRAVLASRPQWTWANGHIFEACLALGRGEEAIVANLGAVADRPALERVLKTARPGADLRALLRLEAEWNETRHREGEPAEGSGILAYLWAAAGHREKALAWLETAVETRDYNALFVLRYPYWDAFHGDPRFEAALDRMGLQGDPRCPSLAVVRSLA